MVVVTTEPRRWRPERPARKRKNSPRWFPSSSLPFSIALITFIHVLCINSDQLCRASGGGGGGDHGAEEVAAGATSSEGLELA